jgi:D-alanine transaminase
MIVYFNGNLIPKENVQISPDDRGFLLADGVYEVICSYGGRIFMLEAHFARLERSLRELGIQGTDLAGLKNGVAELIQANDLDSSDARIYIQITRGAAPRTHVFPGSDTPATVYAAASPFQRPVEKRKHGIKAILVSDIRWTRCDIKSIALLPNVLASQRAKEADAAEALFIRDGAVTEGAHTNFCAVFAERLITYPKTQHILGGITREIVLGLCSELGIPSEERPILESLVREADELLITGTTTEIAPVVQVDDWQVGDGKPGPITRRLQKAFLELTR